MAELIAGMENGGEGEVPITNFLATINSAWPLLTKRWTNDLRKAVQNILGADQRAAERGEENNIVNETSFYDLCGYALKKVEDTNRFAPKMFLFGSEIAGIKTVEELGKSDIEIQGFQIFKTRLNLMAEFRKSIHSDDQVFYQGLSVPEDVAKQIYYHDSLPLPYLRGIVRTPIFTAEGNLVDTPGYAPTTAQVYRTIFDSGEYDALCRTVTSFGDM